MNTWLAQRRKALAPVATLLLGAISLGLFHGTALIAVELVLLAINPAAVHALPNKPKVKG